MAAPSLDNSHLVLSLHPAQNAWSVTGRLPGRPELRFGRSSIAYQVEGNGRRKRTRTDGWRDAQIDPLSNMDSPLGKLSIQTIRSTPDANGLALEWRFGMQEDSPLLLWQVVLHNQGSHALAIREIEMLRIGYQHINPGQGRIQRGAPSGSLHLNEKRGEMACFSNGWQSWGHTGAYHMSDTFRRTRLGPITSPMRVNPGTPQPSRQACFASDFFGVVADLSHRSGIVLGFLSQLQHFGSLETFLDPFAPAVRLWANGDNALLAPGQTLSTDWACLSFIHLDTPDPLGPYLDAVAHWNGLPDLSKAESPLGWCSWYHYFHDIDANKMQANLQAAIELRPQLPLELFQIDDGWQAQIGDWLAFDEGFPEGPAPLARAAAEAGMTSGLWMAPFIVHPRSKLAAEHPDWLLRNRWGLPVNAGFVWNVFTYALDVTNPQALAYAVEAVGTAAHQWGYPYLKLDFLYAAALAGVYHDRSQTRAQALRHALEQLRQAVGPQTTLLGCGCPLGSALGVMDAMRIGADVAPNWHPKYFGTSIFFKPEPDFPSARNAIQNALTRAPLHRRWWVNDPDCLLVRPDTELTLDEVRSLAAVIALTGGALLLSDDLTAIPAERLELARTLLPVIGERPQVLDWIDAPTPERLQVDLKGECGAWSLIGLFNWTDEAESCTLDLTQTTLDPAQTYLAGEFWSGKQTILRGGKLDVGTLAPHGSAVIALRPLRSTAQLAGSSLHISQGMEVSRWQVAGSQLEFSIKRPGQTKGWVCLHLPDMPQSAACNGQPVQADALGEGFYRLLLDFEGRADVVVWW